MLMARKVSNKVEVAAVERDSEVSLPSSRASAVEVAVEALVSNRQMTYLETSSVVETHSLTFLRTILLLECEAANNSNNNNKDRDEEIHSADLACSMTMTTSSAVEEALAAASVARACLAR